MLGRDVLKIYEFPFLYVLQGVYIIVNWWIIRQDGQLFMLVSGNNQVCYALGK